MKMQIEFESRGSFRGAAEERLKRLSVDSVKRFFRCFPQASARKMSLRAFEAATGCTGTELVKIIPAHRVRAQAIQGVPVMVFLEGTQGLVCDFTMDGEREDRLREILNGGPYLRATKSTSVVDDSAVRALPSGNGTAFPDEMAASITETIEVGGFESEIVEKDVMPTKTPVQKLREADVPEDDIERLKATLASIAVNTFGEQEVPNTFRAPVEVITQAILGHMKLPLNDAGNYRGIIGNFYSARIALFGLKLSRGDHAVDDRTQYTDWLFDGELIVDFVGGADQLPHLARERHAEIVALEEANSRHQQAVATATEVETAAQDPFMDDAKLLGMVAHLMEGKAKTEERCALARQNVESSRVAIAAAQQALERAQAQLSEAEQFLCDEERKLSDYVLDADTLARIHQAKSRFDALMRTIGI